MHHYFFGALVRALCLVGRGAGAFFTPG